MSDYHTQHNQGRVLLVGFLFVLGVILWYGGRFWYQHRNTENDSTQADSTQDADEVSLADLHFLSAKEIQARLGRNEAILLVDVRPREDFDTEHVVDSLSVPVTTLKSFSPPPGKFIIVIAGSDTPNVTLKGIHTLFSERKYTFAFLQGNLADWKVAGGTTVSTGDPTSIFDYSKVTFINPEEVGPKANDLIDPVFLDTRSEELFRLEHIPGAINIPLADLEKRRADIPHARSLFVYGSNDYESYQGGVRLFDLNFFGVRAIHGGFTTWKDKKLPTTSENK